MNADPAAQLRLLDLQSCDTAVAQLDHRRRTLPELKALAAAQSRLDDIDQDIVEIRTRLTDIVTEQTRIEGDVDAVRARATRDEQRLTAGGLPPKELESLQHEITSLARRQSTLEDEVLEVMERREELETQETERVGVRAGVEVERDDLTVQRDSHFAEIDAARKTRTADRDGIAAEIPDDLLALYEKVRASSGGTGAAMLRQGRCEGCRMELASSELAALRTAAPDTVLRCDNCRRILIRTGESGL